MIVLTQVMRGRVARFPASAGGAGASGAAGSARVLVTSSGDCFDFAAAAVRGDGLLLSDGDLVSFCIDADALRDAGTYC